MIKSSLASVQILSPNHSGIRTKPISRFTIHHAAGVIGVENLLKIFVPKTRGASCNYAIGNDGRLGIGVSERFRSWCSSSSDNDQRAITVEVSNSTVAPKWEISAKAEDMLVELIKDICGRYKLQGVYFDPNKNNPDKDGWLRITYHEWFKNTNCPGPYVKSIVPRIVDKVNKDLTPGVKELWRVQVGAYSVESNAKSMAEKLKKSGFDTYIVKY